MALVYLEILILVGLSSIINGQHTTNTPPMIKSILDSKKRNDLVDEAFQEQKHVLLDLLEAKLKEVRDKKRKIPDRVQNIIECSKSETLPEHIVLKAEGISSIGKTNVQLTFGKNGNGTLSLDATGISNVGKAHIELGVGDMNVNIPGVDNLLTDKFLTNTRNNKPVIFNETENSEVNNFSNNKNRRFGEGEKILKNLVDTIQISIKNDTVYGNEFKEHEDIYKSDNSILSTLSTAVTLEPEENKNKTQLGNIEKGNENTEYR